MEDLVRLHPSRFLLIFLAVILSTAILAFGKEKKKGQISDYILQAQTVAVVVEPGVGEPLDKPNASQTIRESVERAISQWGRFTVIPEGQEADLVIGIRPGDDKVFRPTIKGGPLDENIRIGQRSQGPPLGGDPRPDPDSRNPRVSNQVGTVTDSFAVYSGRVASPLSSSAIWLYEAKHCLQPPKIAAIEEFRKAIADAAKAKSSKAP